MESIHVRPVEAVLDQPLGLRRAPLLALAALGLPAFLLCDPLIELGEGCRRLLDHDAAGEAQEIETGW